MKSIRQMAKEANIHHSTLSRRLNRGLTITEATQMERWEHRHPHLVAKPTTVLKAIEATKAQACKEIIGDNLTPIYEQREYSQNTRERLAAMEFVRKTQTPYEPIAQRHKRGI